MPYFSGKIHIVLHHTIALSTTQKNLQKLLPWSRFWANNLARHFHFQKSNLPLYLWLCLDFFFPFCTSPSRVYKENRPAVMWTPKERYTVSVIHWNVRKSFIELLVPLEAGYNLLCCLIMCVFVDQLSQELFGAIRSSFVYLSDTSVQRCQVAHFSCWT